MPILSGMLVAATLFAGLLMIVGWLACRRRRASGSGSTLSSSTLTPVEAAIGATDIGATPVEVARDLASQRLWRLAFGTPAEAAPLERGHARVREFICAVLEVDSVNPDYFPRRPALMPQLLQAVNDPSAASEKLSRMIAHDPKLNWSFCCGRSGRWWCTARRWMGIPGRSNSHRIPPCSWS